ncbi:MAG: Mesaconyl-C(4)-CoA hydratase [Rhodocyclaceae bacterium]|nr:Mesaconyl-C(4)-CoA hydratase [Rhodocyclaceae bacterium]
MAGIEGHAGQDQAFDAWIGKREERVDHVNANHLAAWHATLDRDDPVPQEGDPVPPGFHWAMFPPLAPMSELGVDGHPKKGGFLPPIALPRRMWAGGRLTFFEPLRVGERVKRIGTIDRIEVKHGKSGQLVFVSVRYEIIGAAGGRIVEEQDIVYREAVAAGGPAPSVATEPAGAATSGGAWGREIEPAPTLLLRFSALTFNAHRIHYDRDYAMREEGYPGLVVHGPLLATLLLDLVRRQLPTERLARFRFKAGRPTFDISRFRIFGAPGDVPGHYRLWSTDNQGASATEAEAWTD